MTALPTSTLVGIAALMAGLIFGAVAQSTKFCTMGALADIVFRQDYRRFRAWLLAITVAMLGTQMLHSGGVIDVYQSIYLRPNFGWLGALLGGWVFGFGMTMAGGCGHRTLVHVGEGDLRSLIAAVILGIFSYMTLRGLTGVLRVQLEAATNVDLGRAGFTSQSLADFLAVWTGMPWPLAQWLLIAVIALTLLWYCFKNKTFRTSYSNMLGGLVVGGLIPTGWLITGVLGFDEFEPTPFTSFTFVAPIGESLQYVMTFTGATFNFGIAAVMGVVLGAWLMAVRRHEFTVTGFRDTPELLRYLLGAALMGVGGVMALGCTIGQGITGMSTLALGSVLAGLAFLAGGFCGLTYLRHGSVRAMARALCTRRTARALSG